MKKFLFFSVLVLAVLLTSNLLVGIVSPVKAGCQFQGYSSWNCDSCPNGWGGGNCTSAGTWATITYRCNGGGDCGQEIYACDTQPEAKAICDDGSTRTCLKGTCDNSTCGSGGDGTSSCGDFDLHDRCDQVSTCWWESGGSTWNEGWCRGSYCMIETKPGWGCFSYNGSQGYCTANGCHWTQLPDNICADACSLNGAPCGQQQCHDRCTNELVIDGCGTVACSTTNAACVSNTIPTTMSTGQTANVSVIMKNSGDTTWINSGSHPEILGSKNTPANLWGGTAVGLPSASIISGANASFNFNITAPTTQGTYTNYWQMASGSDWFGAICGPSTVTVNQSTCTISGGKHEMVGGQPETTTLASTRALWLGTVPNQQIPISIRASGTAEGGVYPTMTLKVGNDSIKSWTVTNTLLWYTTTVPISTTINQVSVHLYDSSGDRNLRVDLIQAYGVTYQTEGDSVYGEGVNVGGSCQSGTLRSEWLSCNNGFFRFTNLGTTFDPAFSFYALRNIPSGTVTVNSETTDDYTTSYRLGTSGNFTDGNTIPFTCAPNSVNYLYWAYTCNPSAPAAITLSFPANGAIGVSTTPTLGWHTEVDWGKACANPANTYSTIYSLCRTDVTGWRQTAGCSTQMTNNLTGTLQTVGPLEAETTYYWSVRGNNGQSLSPTWPIWSFTTLPPTWWQVIGGDVAGTVVRSDIPSGATNPYINRQSY